MGSTSVKERQAGVLVAILLAAGLAGRVGLAGLLALACAERPPAAPTPSNASSRTDARDAAVLRVGTSGDYAPFSLWPIDATEPEGFSVAVARAFAASRGERIEWVRFRWSELAADLEAKRFDFALSGITVRPDRSALGRFSLPLTTTGATALVLAASRVTTPADLEWPGLRIAVNRGGHLERVARTLFGRAQIDAVDGNAGVPLRLADGRTDAVLTDDLEARVWQRSLPPTRAIGPLTRDRKAAWFPPEAEALLRDFDGWLLAAEAKGLLARLRRQHGLTDSRTAAAGPALLARLDERLALMPAIARAKRTLERPIEDPAQEARVHAAARLSADQAARELGVPAPTEPSLRRFVAAQLAVARFLQTRTLASHVDESTKDGLAAAQRADRARIELEERLRPAAAFLMDRIVWLAVASTAPRAGDALASDAASASPSASREAVAETLSAYALPPELVAEIHAALEGLVPEPAAVRAPVTPPRLAKKAARDHRAGSAPRGRSPSA